MSEKKASGLFRKNLFGGFSKKQVFKYVNDLSAGFMAEREKYQGQIDALKERLSGEQSKVNEFRSELEKLKNQCSALCERENKARIDLQEKYTNLEDSAAQLRASVEELISRNAALVGENESLRAAADEKDEKIAALESDLAAKKAKNELLSGHDVAAFDGDTSELINAIRDELERMDKLLG